MVAGVYLKRSVRQIRARRSAGALVSANIRQRSADFAYSDVEGGRTVFTIRASSATQFKDQNRALLEDVQITIFGKAGDRNDKIHTRECSYQPLTGAIRCAGEVQIDIQGNNPASGKATDDTIDVKTSDLSFNRETGEASTDQPVEFLFRTGRGHGVGVSYQTHSSTMRIKHAVEFELYAQAGAGGMPVNATGSSLEVRRDDRVLILDGRATVRQEDGQVTAGQISVFLDENYRTQRMIAEGRPEIRMLEDRNQLHVSADKFDTLLSPEGWVQSVVADGKITGTRETTGEIQHFSAAHVAVAMLPRGNMAKEMTATGGVIAESRQGGNSNGLKTDALRLTFAARETLGPRSKQQTVQRRIESVETLSPATVESKSGNETTNLRAQKLNARLGPDGRLDQLFGHSGVEVRRQAGSGTPEINSASELAASFGARGDWDTIDEAGNVRFERGDQRASAVRAQIVRATGLATLEGTPVISDSISRTTTTNVAINQQTGEIRANGGVVSTYLSELQGDSVNLGSGTAHISADSLAGSTSSGHFAYSGHARLWQGASVLEAEQIDLWRDDKKAQAKGHVLAIFPQASNPFGNQAGPPSRSSARTTIGPVLWKVRAPVLTYWGDQGKARLEGGVTANSDQASLASKILDVFLGVPPVQTEANRGALRSSDNSTGASKPGADRQLSRVVAQGAVQVRQGDRRGFAEQAEYTAADQKFVLSGGQPTLTDASSDTTTGRSLTFFVANDTILVDSQEGSRTLTKHRVGK